MSRTRRSIRTPRGAAVVASLIITASLAGCAGDGGSDSKDASPATKGEGGGAASSGDTKGSGPVKVTFDDTVYGLDVDLCQVGGGERGYAGPDARMLTAIGEGGFPKFELNHDPEVPGSDKIAFNLSDASYRSNDDGIDINLTATGANGTATLVDTATSDEVEVAFDYTCPEEGPATTRRSSGDEADSGSADGASATGYIEWKSERTEYDAAEGDLNPLEGTGLCETHDVTGSQGDDYYRIGADLEDGKYFKPLGLRHQMLLAIPSPDNRMNVLVLSRTTEDFAARDIAMLGALRPHLTLGCRTSATTSISETEAVAGGWMVVSADSDGTITATSTPDATGTFVSGESLPTELVDLPETEGLTVGTAIEFAAPTTRWLIRVVSSGGPERVFLAQLLARTSNDLAPLTARQREVLHALSQGCTNREIADRLGIAEATAKKHLQHIFQTLGVTNRVAAAARVRNGST